MILRWVLVLILIISIQNAASQVPTARNFIYNNTYEYDVLYDIVVNNTTEYIMEFSVPSLEDNIFPTRMCVSSVETNLTYPLFITAGQQKGISSWQLPMLVETKTSNVEYTNISRTLCPHGTTGGVTPINRPLIHISTSSPSNVTAKIKVEKVTDFYVTLNTWISFNSTPSQPKYYFYSFEKDPKNITRNSEDIAHNSKDINRNSLDIKDTSKGYNNSQTNIQNTPYISEDIGYNLPNGNSMDIKNKSMAELPRSSYNSTRKTVLSKFLLKSKTIYSKSIPKFNITIPKSVILIIESDNDICATVSIQNYSCPVFDNERDILYEGYYLTMMSKGGITLTQTNFPNGFYIVFIVKASDEDCLGPIHNQENSVSTFIQWDDSDAQEVTVSTRGREKNFRFKIIPTISYKEYLIGALAAFGFFISFYLLFLISLLLFNRKVSRYLVEEIIVSVNEDEVMASSSGIQDNGDHSEDIAPHKTSTDQHISSSEEVPFARMSVSDSDSEQSVKPPSDTCQTLVSKLTLASLATKRHSQLTTRSDKYLWNVLTVSVFYALPVVQLVITYQGMLIQTGNQDLCYYNFLCAHPLGFLSDWNHVYSNLGYVLLGGLFLIQVSVRQYRNAMKPKNVEYGIPEHYGLFYAMGVGLIMEGILSASYHVCPNKMNFQFDTSFMYVIAVLCMIKIYQTRHPDINARAHSTFGVLACIIFIGLFGILNASLYFWVLFTILHVVTCLMLTFRIYYLGRIRLETHLFSRAWTRLRTSPRNAVKPHYVGRFVLLVLANLANWALAGYGLYKHKKDFAQHLLAILMGNTILYTLFYICMKVLHREKIKIHSWLYIISTHIAWVASLYFFLDHHTKWSLTPAQSRSLNGECYTLGLYDAHDIWHFLSAIAMYLSFNLLLTMDDGMSTKRRDEIAVF